MTPEDQRVADAYKRGELSAIVHQHGLEIRQLDQHMQATAEILAGIRKDTGVALESIRIQLARVMVAVPIVVVMSNAFVALLVYEITR